MYFSDKRDYERRNSFTRRVNTDESNKEQEDPKNNNMDRVIICLLNEMLSLAKAGAGVAQWVAQWVVQW